MKNQLGKTQDAGFQFGIRRTVPVPVEKAWDFLFSEEGVKIWLGKLRTTFELGRELETEEGISGRVRVWKPLSHIRMSWKPKAWEHASTLQIRIIGTKKKSVIAIHQEKLLNAAQREEMKQYWTEVMGRLIKALAVRE